MLALFRKKHAALHWYIQRMTAIALLPLFAWMLFQVTLSVSHAPDLASLVQSLVQQNPFVLLLLHVLLFWHIQHGLESIVIDYVHHDVRVALLQSFIRILTVVMMFLGPYVVLHFLP